MNKVENSIKFWGIYLIVSGISFFALPLKMVQWFGYEAHEDLWIRFLGMIMCVLGIYYFLIAFFRINVLYYAKVWTHLFGIVCMLILWIFAYADARIIPTIIIETGACLWTLLTIKKLNYQKITNP